MMSPLPALLLLPLLAPLQAPEGRMLPLRGTVTLDGKPVEGAVVHLGLRRYPLPEGQLDLASTLVEESTKSDGKGRFLLSVPAWRRVTLHATHEDPSGTRRASPFLDGISYPFPPVELKLLPPLSVSGRFLYRRRPPGREIPFRLVRALGEEEGAPYRVQGRSRADGTFRVEGLPPGSWQLQLGSPDRRLKQPVVIDGPRKDLTIPLARAVSLTLRLASIGGAMGRPVQGARIQLFDGSHFFTTTTRENGVFELRGIESGPGATFLVEKEGVRKDFYFLEPGLSPRSPAPQAQLTRKEGREARGRLLDASGRPLGGIEVCFGGFLTGTGLAVQDLSLVVRTDEKGFFHTKELHPGTLFKVWALLPGGEAQLLFRLVPGKGGPDYGSFRLGSGRVRVKLHLPGASPPPGIRIYGPKETGEFFANETLVPDGEGWFLSPSMMPGEYAIIGLSPALGLSRKVVRIRRGEKDPLVVRADLTMAKPRLVSGVIRDRNKKPIPGVEVRLVQEGGGIEGSGRDWTSILIEELTRKFFPSDKFPMRATSNARGEYEVWCHEATGKYDLLVDPMPRPPEGGGALEEGRQIRFSDVLGKPPPVDVVLDH